MATEQVPGEDRAMVGEQAPTEEVSASVKEDPCKETTNQVGNDGAIHPIQNAKVAVRVFCNLSVLSDVISLVKTSKVFHEVYVTNTRLILLAVLSRSLPHFADAEALLEVQKGETERHKLQAIKENPSENLTNGVTKNGTEAGTDITVETPKEETSVEQPQVENVASESSASIQQPGATSPGEPLDNDSIQASAIDTQKMQELSLEELLNDVEILKAAADAKKLQNATLEKPVKLEGDSGDAATDVKKLDQVALPQPANSEDGSEDTIGWAKQLLANHRTVMTACQFFEKLTHPRVSQADAVEAARRTRAFNPRGNRAPVDNKIYKLRSTERRRLIHLYYRLWTLALLSREQRNQAIDVTSLKEVVLLIEMYWKWLGKYVTDEQKEKLGFSRAKWEPAAHVLFNICREKVKDSEELKKYVKEIWLHEDGTEVVLAGVFEECQQGYILRSFDNL